MVVLPAYNAGKTILRTIKAIPKSVSKIIIVDDNSSDNTIALIKKLNHPKIAMYRHAKNLGYGGNQKTCYRIALKTKADIIAMIHPDYQYDPTFLPVFTELISIHKFDLILGTRIRTRREALASGMPVYKYYANRMLTLLQNILTGQNLSEWHTGLRVYRRSLLEKVPLQHLSDSFVFDTELLLCTIAHKAIIGEISIPARYFPEASSIGLGASIRYGLETLKETLRFVVTGYTIKAALRHKKV